MSPSKKSPKLVSPKAKKGKKGAASVFPKAKGGKTWSLSKRHGFPPKGKKKKKGGSRTGVYKSDVGSGNNPHNAGAGLRNLNYPARPETEFVWVWNYGEGWELEELRK